MARTHQNMKQKQNRDASQLQKLNMTLQQWEQRQKETTMEFLKLGKAKMSPENIVLQAARES